MIVLGLDTCLNACSVAVLDGEAVLASASEVMARGHQERLAPMVGSVMAQAGLPFSSLQRIGVTVGPGSFTGLRVGVAFAKGLVSALEVESAGVGVLEALASPEVGLVAAVLDARRNQLYLQAFKDGAPLMVPEALPATTAASRLAEVSAARPLILVGSGAPLLASAFPAARVVLREGCDAIQVARLAAGRPATTLRPLYLRAPDARLPA